MKPCEKCGNEKFTKGCDECTQRYGLEIIKIVAVAIRDLGCVPEGELYAHLMGTLSLRNLETILGNLEKVGAIRRKHHMIVWIGGMA